ncbi:MAG TPA: ABC transporter permease subunit [Candidatus Acidoferrum sp.]|nr:ABC transporter permease subunit [Candidatus Acidoferrum sp.]
MWWGGQFVLGNRDLRLPGLKNVPREMLEAAQVYRLSWWQRFIQLELPYAAIGLVWNSMMSVAGGWFFLILPADPL